MAKEKMKIMVADDDPGILDALMIMLVDAGYDVVTTVNGLTVRDIGEELPDLILLDLWMSGMDGRDICSHLKAQKRTAHIPIIIFSANKDAKNIAVECGADDFIAKPFEMKELLQKIESYKTGAHSNRKI